jgi:hypothetical protein
VRHITGSDLHKIVEFLGFIALAFGFVAVLSNSQRSACEHLAESLWNVFVFIAALCVGMIAVYYLIWGGFIAYAWLGITPVGILIASLVVSIPLLINDVVPARLLSKLAGRGRVLLAAYFGIALFGWAWWWASSEPKAVPAPTGWSQK